MCNRASYLIHYGVKGQKYGIRRWQNEDGSLTEEGRRHYGIGEGLINKYRYEKEELKTASNAVAKEDRSKISNRRKVLEKAYLDKGFSEKQARAKALEREKIEKVLKVAGAILVTSAAIYGAYKGRQLIKRYADTTIKKGTALQRVTSDPTDVVIGRPGYISPDKKDFVKYRGLYGRQIENKQELDTLLAKLTGESIQKPASGVFAVKGVASDNMRIAGEKTGSKVFKNLMKNDPKFKQVYTEVVNSGQATPLVTPKKISDYERFNYQLANAHTQSERKFLQERFFGELSKKGYNGVLDLNDIKFSGYQSKRPTILFNLKNTFVPKDAVKLPSEVMKKDYETAHKLIEKQVARKGMINGFIHNAGKVTLGSAVFGGTLIFNNSAVDAADRKTGAQYREIIRRYKKDHPNTQLSDDHILENLLGA